MCREGSTVASELVRRAVEMIPHLQEHSEETDTLRNLPPDNVDLLTSAGIVRMMQPKEFGGLGLGMEDLVDVGLELGRGCGATAWMAVQWPVHNFMVGMYPRSVQELYWSKSPDTLSSTCNAGAVTFEEAEGGKIVSGRFKFSSGIDWAEWLQVLCPGGNFLLPRGDFEIIDDWHVTGLRGSGSKSVSFGEVFVPEERILSRDLVENGRTPAAERLPSPFYKVPLLTWAAPTLSAAIVGMARGVVEQFEVRTRSRTTRAGAPATGQPGPQLRYAEATAEVEAAQLLLRQVIRDVKAWGSSARPMPATEQARVRLNTSFATRLALRATTRLAEGGDSSAVLYNQYLLQRLIRDTRAGALHVSQAWDDVALQYSRVRWGVDADETAPNPR